MNDNDIPGMIYIRDVLLEKFLANQKCGNTLDMIRKDITDKAVSDIRVWITAAINNIKNEGDLDDD